LSCNAVAWQPIPPAGKIAQCRIVFPIRDFRLNRGAGNPARSHLSDGFLPVANSEEPAAAKIVFPAMRLRAAVGCQLAGVRLSARFGGLSRRIVAARKDSQVS